MAQGSTIEWTESTWNPVTGCTKISPGCRHCYAECMAMRLQAMGRHQQKGSWEEPDFDPVPGKTWHTRSSLNHPLNETLIHFRNGK